MPPLIEVLTMLIKLNIEVSLINMVGGTVLNSLIIALAKRY